MTYLVTIFELYIPISKNYIAYGILSLYVDFYVTDFADNVF